MNGEGIVASLVGALGIVLTVLTFLWAIRPSRQAVGRLKEIHEGDAVQDDEDRVESR